MHQYKVLLGLYCDLLPQLSREAHRKSTAVSVSSVHLELPCLGHQRGSLPPLQGSATVGDKGHCSQNRQWNPNRLWNQTTGPMGSYPEGTETCR